MAGLLWRIGRYYLVLAIFMLIMVWNESNIPARVRGWARGCMSRVAKALRHCRLGIDTTQLKLRCEGMLAALQRRGGRAGKC